MNDWTDDDLVRMHRDGDREAFQAIFDRHYGSVYRLAAGLLRDAHKAEDLLQEAFVAAFRALPGYEPRGQFRAWLLRIARNRCLNRIEADRARPVLADSAALEAQDPTSSEPSPAGRLAADESESAVRAALADLPERQREALSLYAFEQMTYQEIAHVMEMPINTVKTLIYRARAAVAGRLVSFRKELGRDL